MTRNEMLSILSPAERRILGKLTIPRKIQDYLDQFPINFETKGETYMSPRRVFKAKTAHCLEGALVAAAALAYHGQKPLLLDFRTVFEDEDHVVALFKQNGRWGAISKTNHAILRYRDPLYRDVRELVMSYFHEYLLWNGRKSLESYGVLSLSHYAPKRWVTAEEDLFWLVDALDNVRHFPIVTKKTRRLLRPAAKVELRAMKTVEWKPPRGFKGGA